MRFLVSFALALSVHALAGWSWSILGGVLYGYLLKSHSGIANYLFGGLGGAMCVGASWGALVVYNLVVAPDSTLSMMDVMGGILGNLPGGLIVVLTVLLGGILGLLGALVGIQIKKIF